MRQPAIALALVAAGAPGCVAVLGDYALESGAGGGSPSSGSSSASSSSASSAGSV